VTAPIGILGGTFDPVHFGHLRLAQEVAEHAQLGEVRFIPSATPPHRTPPQASVAHRTAMVKLAIDGNPLFVLDERETRRDGPSYSVDTLADIRKEVGAAQPLVLLLGADAFLGLTDWHRWRELFDFAHVVVAHRPGFEPATWQGKLAAPLAQEYAARLCADVHTLHGAPAGSIMVVPTTALDISATAVRAALHAGRSARYLLPAEVIAHIRAKCLYL
jgi:nicotinate-nucleotide adenylyltransferase